MMDLSKQLNSPQMIQLTQIFAQQPRNTVRRVFSGLWQTVHLGLTLPLFVL
jgi:hypothetical protein